MAAHYAFAECVICFEEIETDEEHEGRYGYATKCGHLYHKACLIAQLTPKIGIKDSGHSCATCGKFASMRSSIRLFVTPPDWDQNNNNGGGIHNADQNHNNNNNDVEEM